VVHFLFFFLGKKEKHSFKMKHLILKNVNSGYPDKIVLEDINFDVKSGEFIGIIGPNGAGKSTLLKTITRIIKPIKGEIYLRKKRLENFSYKDFAKRIACVSQEDFIPFSYNVYDMVMMGRFPYQPILTGERPKDKDIVENMLDITDTISLASRDILSLSAGEKQRVIIARALAQEPEILFLDEPTSHLDIGHQVKIFDILKDLNQKQGVTIVSILHDLNLASEYCDKLLLLNKGRIAKYDMPDEILDYRLLEEVYDTLVVVKKNPISNKPYVVLVPGSNKE